MTDTGTQEFLAAIRAIPKADLHVHLEGTVTYPTFLELCHKNGIDPEAPVQFGNFPPLTPPKITGDSWPGLGGFKDFIRLYLKITDAIRTPEDLLLIGARYLEACAEENIVRSEMYFSATTFARFERQMDGMFSALALIGRLASDRYRHRLSYIFDIVRNASADGAEVIELAEKARSLGVEVGAIGVAGLEAGNPASRYKQDLERARSLGYRILIHSGELTDPAEGAASMLDTAGLLPDRIGHGLAALEDISLLDRLRASGTAIELCPWSNLLLQIRTEDLHPAAKIIESGLPVLICSDDPGIFSKSLTDNYLLCRQLGVPDAVLLQLAANSLVI